MADLIEGGLDSPQVAAVIEIELKGGRQERDDRAERHGGGGKPPTERRKLTKPFTHGRKQPEPAAYFTSHCAVDAAKGTNFSRQARVYRPSALIARNAAAIAGTLSACRLFR